MSLADLLGGLATRRELARWADLETAFWKTTSGANRDYSDAWKRLNDQDRSIFLIDLADGRASIRPKPTFFTREEIAAGNCVDTGRALLYRDFLGEVARRYPSQTPLTIALNVSDAPGDSYEAPIFAFLKRRGSPNILLPDVDFFYRHWYASTADPKPFEEKALRISFGGGSSGGVVTVDAIDGDSLPRLALARALISHPRIEFKIGSAVQCADDAARAHLKRQPYFSTELTWEAQLGSRYILSMDGNGATCSRVVLTLKSNSVLLKMLSDSLLYYFHGLVPGRHYLSVSSIEDMERLLALDDAGRMDTAAINRAGKEFFRRNLTKPSVLRYTASLLNAFQLIGATGHGRKRM